MEFVIFTYDGHFIPVAEKLEKEGKVVHLGIVSDASKVGEEEKEESKKRRLKLGEGLVKRRYDADTLLNALLKENKPEKYFIIFDFNYFYEYAEKLREKGFVGLLPYRYEAELEKDRKKAKDFVKKNYPEVKVAEYYEFNNVQEGINFLKETDKRWVLKGNSEIARTVVPDSEDVDLAKEELIDILEEDSEKMYSSEGFILEEIIEDPIELTPELVYWNGKRIFATLDIELKRFGAGETSIQTGCSADLVFPISLDNPIIKISFPSIVDEMAKRHKGLFIFDISLLIDKNNNIYFGEFCPNRFGYNAIFTEIAQTGASSYFEKAQKGENPFGQTYGASIRVFNMLHDEKGRVLDDVLFAVKGSEENVFFWDLRKKDGKYYTIGYDWNTAVITGVADNPLSAVLKAIENTKKIVFDGAYMRNYLEDLWGNYRQSLKERFQYYLLRFENRKIDFNNLITEEEEKEFDLLKELKDLL